MPSPDKVGQNSEAAKQIRQLSVGSVKRRVLTKQVTLPMPRLDEIRETQQSRNSGQSHMRLMSFGSNMPIEDESLERNDPFLDTEE